MVQLKSTSKYFLSNQALGSSFTLASAPSNDSLVIVPIGLDTSKLWYFTETDLYAYFYLHTVEKGDWYVLDVFNDNGIPLEFHFFPRHGASGQYWTMQDQKDGTVKLSNNFTGPSLYLDVDQNTLKPTLALGDQPGMRWNVNEVATSSTTFSTTQSMSMTTSSFTASTLTPTSSASNSPARTNAPLLPGTKGHGLSGGAIAGIVIGVLILVALAAIAGCCAVRRRTRREEIPPIHGMTGNQAPVMHFRE